MKKIPLTRGKFAMVDDEDYDYLMQWKWFAQKNRRNFYAIRTEKVNGKSVTIKMNRLIMGCKKGDGKTIDHKDHDGLNNQRHNLREVTSLQNNVNRRAKTNGVSKYLGVCESHRKRNSKTYTYYTAGISINKKHVWLGTFPHTKEGEKQAAKAYNDAAIKQHGEFANLNNIN